MMIEASPLGMLEFMGGSPRGHRGAGKEKEELVERGDPRGQLGSIAEDSAAVDHPADPFGLEGTSRRQLDVADPVDARDADRPQPTLGLAELPRQVPIPAGG